MRRYRALRHKNQKRTLKTLRNSSFDVSTKRGQANASLTLPSILLN